MVGTSQLVVTIKCEKIYKLFSVMLMLTAFVMLFFLSLTEYIQAMVLVNEATLSNNLALIKGMFNPNLEHSLVFSYRVACQL